MGSENGIKGLSFLKMLDLQHKGENIKKQELNPCYS